LHAGGLLFASHPNHAHQQIENSGLNPVFYPVTAISARFEAQSVDDATQFRLTEQRSDTLVQRRVQ
jgi:hypothetical protein